MNTDPTSPAQPFEIFLVAAPGLEPVLCAEAGDRGFTNPTVVKGGVTVTGGWPEVWRANLELRGATRVLARIASFRALHLAQLDKRARRVPWAEILRADIPVRVEASCKASRIYHAGAAAQRIERAIAEELGAPIVKAAPKKTGKSADRDTPEEDTRAVQIKARIDDDLCTISVDSSGESLHKRGHKEAVNKAPMRETLAALFLRQCGYDGREPVPVVDPMCGSGTFVIEAAEIAAGLKPGRSRSFAFEQLATFDAARWQSLRSAGTVTPPAVRFYGSDRDAGAITMSRANAERAGVGAWTDFAHHAISDLTPPEGPPGLVIVNPPYGARIGEGKSLIPLYHAMGQTLKSRFTGWRVGIITNEAALAKATELPFQEGGVSVSNGGIRVTLYQTGVLE
ncbi:putative N6-adenine-specific DNA methylase [Azospirillum lipoferum]|uniref:Class I SAM-dependent RNA methyltransferase n=1 Tax=Azospirillum lipoferum TaxID=193 RepID=A0A5A9GQL3_AZOLI|nr:MULTISPECIES: class I SAM-dependent RNA methyltransferase [Azospirillum]KAA0596771.1 class I SAM-dependent RNA methyltransferase [Azospirillum lipoferum]MCP1610800.1 putative N6-adenine-specific DNA methylase [Azospirillum lipoferum]MDW5537757.1 class I SAM-dependent RNA methyltransferase [Azospirillum sp. NL1]